MLRLHRELEPEIFGLLLTEYRRLLQEVFEGADGVYIEGVDDTVVAGFSTAKQAIQAAAARSRNEEGPRCGPSSHSDM